MHPARAVADSVRLAFRNPLNPLSHTALGRGTAAALEVFERTTRRYAKPEFQITETDSRGIPVGVTEEVVWEKPFCRLIHFRKDYPDGENRDRSRVLLVAPLSGHYATLLRGTVQGLLPRHDVYITDWRDARNIPLLCGQFDLDSYIDYLMEMYELFHGNVHVIGVCQPSVPVLASVSLMEAEGNPNVPLSMTLLGGPIDTRRNPTAVNELAEKKSIKWFERNVIMSVPWPNPGFGRRVYPGFLQLTGFMTMNMDRHLSAHKNLFVHLIEGDGDSATKHREFYDEYLAVMDLTAEFYLQTVETVFMSHSLGNGTMTHNGVRVDPSKIKRVALMTVEGEKDDITGIGQCAAAHDLCVNIPSAKKIHYEQPGVGHYGIFNGSRFRADIAPRISDFIANNQPRELSLGRALRAMTRTTYRQVTGDEKSNNVTPFPLKKRAQ